MQQRDQLLPVSDRFDWPALLDPLLRLASRTAQPDDPPDLAFRKVTLTAAIILMLPVTPLSALGAWFTGQQAVAAILLVLSVVDAVLLYVLLQHKQWVMTVGRIIALANMAVAFGLTTMQGGFLSSGANSLWGLFGPLVIGFLISPVEGAVWFLIYAALTIATVLMDPVASPVGNGPVISNILFSQFALFGCLAYFELRRRQTEQRLHEQRLRADALLHNVLPDSIVDRLKGGETQMAQRFDDVSVCFIDLVGFTPLSASLPPEQVVELLDGLFRKLDAAVARHGIEKIKTIGDAYMVASGVPEPRDDHLQAIARFALEARQIITDTSLEGHTVDARIGLHAGPVVAGVIGEKRFAYDLWGDTVNTASRMESSGEPGRVQCTAEVAKRLGDGFAIEPRGTIEVKGKGAVDVAFLGAG